MKKFLLSSALLLAALAARAQGDVAEGELNYIFDHETMTATVTQNRWWKENGDGTGGQWHNTYSGDIVLPETVAGYTVVAIGEYAFANIADDSKSISSIVIPKTVKTIGERAFQGCFNLKTITIPATVESIGQMVFSGSAIETLTISDGDTPLDIGGSGSVVGSCLTFTGLKTAYVGRDINRDMDGWVGRSTFANASTITDVTYGPQVTKINPGEFFRNDGVKRVVFLMDELDIPDDAFHSATSLTTVTLPQRVTTIGKEAFSDVPSLTSLTIPPTVNIIGENAFSGCDALTELTIPATTTSIGKYAFSSSGLEKLTISDSEQPLSMGWSCFSSMEEGQVALYIGRPLIVGDQSESPWSNVKSLREITYGGHYSGMMAEEARNATGLQKIVISSPYVTEIPEHAFRNCGNLTSVTLHDGIKVIGKDAFHDDKQLGSITLPDQLTTVHENAFYNCDFRSVTIPASVTLLGTNSFGTWEAMSYIVSLNPTPPVCEGFPFYYGNKARSGEMKLYVPQGADTAYRNAEHWKEFYVIETGDIPTGIHPSASITPQPTLPTYYTLDGRKLNEAPSRPGCYICNGKKIMK